MFFQAKRKWFTSGTDRRRGGTIIFWLVRPICSWETLVFSSTLARLRRAAGVRVADENTWRLIQLIGRLVNDGATILLTNDRRVNDDDNDGNYWRTPNTRRGTTFINKESAISHFRAFGQNYLRWMVRWHVTVTQSANKESHSTPWEHKCLSLEFADRGSPISPHSASSASRADLQDSRQGPREITDTKRAWKLFKSCCRGVVAFSSFFSSFFSLLYFPGFSLPHTCVRKSIFWNSAA